MTSNSCEPGTVKKCCQLTPFPDLKYTVQHQVIKQTKTHKINKKNRETRIFSETERAKTLGIRRIPYSLALKFCSLCWIKKQKGGGRFSPPLEEMEWRGLKSSFGLMKVVWLPDSKTEFIAVTLKNFKPGQWVSGLDNPPVPAANWVISGKEGCERGRQRERVRGRVPDPTNWRVERRTLEPLLFISTTQKKIRTRH